MASPATPRADGTDFNEDDWDEFEEEEELEGGEEEARTRTSKINTHLNLGNQWTKTFVLVQGHDWALAAPEDVTMASHEKIAEFEELSLLAQQMQLCACMRAKGRRWTDIAATWQGARRPTPTALRMLYRYRALI